MFYGRYANRVRGERAREEPKAPADTPPRKRRCSASWARLISKVYDADPLICKKCGGKLKVVAYLHDQAAIHEIVDHLGLSPPEEPKPPPEAPDVVCVPVDDEGYEIAGNPWAPAAIARRPASATTPRPRAGGLLSTAPGSSLPAGRQAGTRERR